MALLFPKSQPTQRHSHRNESIFGRPLLVFPWFWKFSLQKIKTGGLQNVYWFQVTNKYQLRANKMAQLVKTLPSRSWDWQPEFYPQNSYHLPEIVSGVHTQNLKKKKQPAHIVNVHLSQQADIWPSLASERPSLKKQSRQHLRKDS